MEAVDGAVVVGDGLLGHGLFDLQQVGVELLDVGGLGMAHGIAGAAALQQAENREQHLDVMGGQLDDEGAATGDQADEALVGQHLQGLAQRGA